MDRVTTKKWVLRVLKRILVEFSFPAAAATVWYFTASKSSLQGWALFFVSISWFSGQIFRIIKQQKVEGEFDVVKTRLNEMVSTMENQIRKVVGHATGGVSNTYLYPIEDHQGRVRLFIVNESEFSCQLVSIGMYEYTEDGKSIKLHSSEHDVLHRVLWYPFGYTIQPFDGSKNYKIHHQTRTGASYVQYIKIEKIGQHYIIAFTKSVDGKLHYVVPENFPGYDGINSESLFVELRKKPING